MASKPYELFSAAFSKDTHRTPRSREYKQGVLALLRRQMEGTPIKCPWDIGTASFDAFFAGVDEGWSILRKHGITSREQGVALPVSLCRCPDGVCLLHPNSPDWVKKCSLKNPQPA